MPPLMHKKQRAKMNKVYCMLLINIFWVINLNNIYKGTRLLEDK